MPVVRQEPGQSGAAKRGRTLAIVLVLLAVGAVLRLYRIEHEPFWHDEVYTHAFSDENIPKVFQDNAQDVHPPLFYTGLYLWRQMFGDSSSAMRSYSTAWSLIGLVALFLLARDIGGRRVGLIALVLGVVHPHDIYHAQEARMYSQAVALFTLSCWCLWRWIAAATESRRPSAWWRWAAGHGLFAAAALFTHHLCIFLLLAQGIFAGLWALWNRQWPTLVGYAIVTLAVAAVFLPWLVYVLQFRETFYNPRLSWLKEPKAHFYVSFLGSELLWGWVRRIFEHWWAASMVVPVALLGVCVWRLAQGGLTNPDLPTIMPRVRIAYPLWLLFVPVILAGIAVYVYHPVYFRPRFSMLILPAFLVLAAVACDALRPPAVRWVGTVALVGLIGTAMVIQQRTYQRIWWKEVEKIWPYDVPPVHTVFFPRDLEVTIRHDIDLPVHSATIEEIEQSLDQIQGREIWVFSILGYGYDDYEGQFDYYQWLLGLGSVRHVSVHSGVMIEAIKIGGHSIRQTSSTLLDRFFWPIDVSGRLEGIMDTGQFNQLEAEPPDLLPFRWSNPKAWIALGDKDPISTVVLLAMFPPPIDNYKPELKVYARRGKRMKGLFESAPATYTENWMPGVVDVKVSAPPGPGKLWIGWTMNPMNLKEAGASEDPRDLGLRIQGVGTLINPSRRERERRLQSMRTQR
jgi:4-amino-4-deoxy-L-arabinose transferase-like glycosyltransferase